MLTWLRRLFVPQPVTRRELMAFRDVIDGLDARVDQHYDELRQLRGKVNSLKRGSQGSHDPGDAIDQTTDISPGPRPVAPTAHLARRFRGT